MVAGRKLSHSQNFLKSGNYVKRLLKLTDIRRGDLVVEIGSGKGIITAELAREAGRVVAVELDANLVRSLRQRFQKDLIVKVVEADFLRWKLPLEPYKVFANIPFNMTADIVNKLMFADNPPLRAYLFMQDKAAMRFIGRPVSQNSQISIFLQPFYDMRIETDIPRNQFFPKPSVDIVLTSFKRREKLWVDWPERKLFWDFVAYGYNQRQPTALEAFIGVFTSKQLKIVERNFELSGLKPSQLRVDQWLNLFGAFLGYVPEDKRKIISGAVGKLRRGQRGMVKQYRTRGR